MPDRTCIGCRTVRDKAVLVRLFAGPDGVVAVDSSGVMGGRGAYICPERACLEAACRNRGGLARALRRTDLGPPDVEGLWNEIRVGLAGGSRAGSR